MINYVLITKILKIILQHTSVPKPDEFLDNKWIQCWFATISLSPDIQKFMQEVMAELGVSYEPKGVEPDLMQFSAKKHHKELEQLVLKAVSSKTFQEYLQIEVQVMHKKSLDLGDQLSGLEEKLTAMGNFFDTNSEPACPTCPITLGPLHVPVIIQTGHTFEAEAIQEWFKNHNTCPLTRREVNRNIIIPNLMIKQQCELYWAYQKLKSDYDSIDGEIYAIGKQLTDFESLKKIIPADEFMPETEKPKLEFA